MDTPDSSQPDRIEKTPDPIFKDFTTTPISGERVMSSTPVKTTLFTADKEMVITPVLTDTDHKPIKTALAPTVISGSDTGIPPKEGTRIDTPTPLVAGTEFPKTDYGARPETIRTDAGTRNDIVKGEHYSTLPVSDGVIPKPEKGQQFEANIHTAELQSNKITLQRPDQILSNLPTLSLERNKVEPVLSGQPVLQGRIVLNEARPDRPLLVSHEAPPQNLLTKMANVANIANLNQAQAGSDSVLDRPAFVHAASHLAISEPNHDGRAIVMAVHDSGEPLSPRMNAFLENAISFFTSDQDRARQIANVSEGIRRTVDLGQNVLSLMTVMRIGQIMPQAFNIMTGRDVSVAGNAALGLQSALVAGERSLVTSPIINAVRSALLTGLPVNGAEAALQPGLRGNLLTPQGLLNAQFNGPNLAGVRGELGAAQSFTIRGDVGRNINLVNAGLTGSIDLASIPRIGRKKRPGEPGYETLVNNTTGNDAACDNIRLITGLELGLIIALAGIAKYDDRSNRKVANMSGMESSHQALDAMQSGEKICKAIAEKKIQKRLPSYNWNNQWKSPEKIKVKGILKKLKEERKDLKQKDFQKLESATNAEELLNRLSKIVTKDEKRLDAKRLLSNFATTLEEKLNRQKNPAAQMQNIGSSYRPLWLVTKKDSLTVLADQIYQDPDVGWLIADMNIRRVRETWMNGKRVIELQSRQQLELPIQEDIDLFKANKAKEASAENLITIVVENQLDKDLVNSQLQALQIKRKAIEST